MKKVKSVIILIFSVLLLITSHYKPFSPTKDISDSLIIARENIHYILMIVSVLLVERIIDGFLSKE